MVARVKTVAFQGIEVLDIDVEVQVAPGLAGFSVVGLPDKAVAESRERVRAAFSALGLALPARRIVVNLAPADVLKEGSHFDLPIALGLLVAMGIVDQEDASEYTVLGELGLDGRLARVAGVLLAAFDAASHGRGLICPEASGNEAAWIADIEILAPPSLLALVNHFKGTQVLIPPQPRLVPEEPSLPDLADIKGQETAKRALEIVAAGGHNLLMIGPPGAGKSMLAHRLPGLLPPLTPREVLEVSMIHSLAGTLTDGAIRRRRPFRDPHHSASLPALVGGGHRAKPGEISLAHRGVLFLDELPEFSRATLESLRQPLETGRVTVARANHHLTYPARVQLIAAMNPCRCGHLGDEALGCPSSRWEKCSRDYQARLSGPLLDRIDAQIEVPSVKVTDLILTKARDDTKTTISRIAMARTAQDERYTQMDDITTNAEIDGDALMRIATPDEDGQALLSRAALQLRLSARGYHRILRLARTIADLEGCDAVRHPHIAEALSFRRGRVNPT
ncbi:MAG: YifB family Mg chelatase-like AAA ATPase [Alphaproteobacteria bacterium]